MPNEYFVDWGRDTSILTYFLPIWVQKSIVHGGAGDLRYARTRGQEFRQTFAFPDRAAE